MVDLHCHSCYSFLDGASHPEELVARAVELGYTALALTDHNGVYGSLEFAQAATAAGLQAITGAEVTLEDDSHLTLLAASPTGYANLCRLLSTAHRESERTRPRLRWAVLPHHAAGLICLSGCSRGRIPQLLESGCWSEAARAACELREWFGAERFYLEAQQNLVYGDWERLQALAVLSARTGIPLVATNNTHYHVRARWRLQDTMVAIREGLSLDESHRYRRANSEFALKQPRTLRARFRDYPQALENALEIAVRCSAFDITKDLGYTFPDFQRDEGQEGLTASQALRKRCEEALQVKYGREAPARQAEAREWLEKELRLVDHHGLAGFFLVYRDLLEMAKEIAAELRGTGPRGRFELPPGRGRGSAVSSIICYLIGLSPVDPVQAKLFPGRFLNESLSSVPDIDLDFPRDIRAELFRRIHERYGNDHVALVNIMPAYRFRSAVREVGQALALPPAELDRLARTGSSRALVGDEMDRLPEFAGHGAEHRWQLLRELGEQIQGMPRHLSQHVGGVVISSRPLVEIVPVENAAMEGRQLIQWDKDSCDAARLIKVDLLALGMLSAVEECLELIVANGKPAVDLARISFDDRRVFARICRGETVGAFQIESRGQIGMLVRTRPQNMEELAVQVAIVRPGPIVANAVNPYVRRKEQLRRGTLPARICDHPLLEPVLADTLGVTVYQDQVMEVCKALAGFTDGQADQLRRAMSRKRSRENIERFRGLFLAGADRNGVDEATACAVFEKVVAFSEFGFPKSHAAAFAVLAYQSTWLLHYHPAEFLASVINAHPMGFYSPDTLVKEGTRRGIRFLAPCVNRSALGCTVRRREVRLGLKQVKGLGEEGAAAILAEREREGPFRSLADLVRRTRLSERLVEALSLVGALDVFGENRRELLWEGGLLDGQRGHSFRERTEEGVREVAHQPTLALPTEQDRVTLAQAGRWERVAHEYRLLGLSVSGHPMGLLRRLFPPGILTTRGARAAQNGTIVQVAGMVTSRQQPQSANGILFLLLEDEFGMLNVVVQPEELERRRAVYRNEALVVVRGTLQRRERERNLVALEVWPLTELLPDSAKSRIGQQANEAVRGWDGPDARSFR